MKGRLATESADYRKLRDELAQAEIELREQRERVAGLRRRLPLDQAIDDQVFREGPRDLRGGDTPVREVRLSELFEQPDRPLLLMHFMYGKKQEQFCPMCTMWADGYSGLAPHIRRRANFAVLIAGAPEPFREYARGRGWDELRIVSAADSTLKRELGFEDEDGAQHPGVSVFLSRGGRILHSYSACALMADDQVRGMDLLCPTWHFFDLLPDGRGEWFPSRQYQDA